MATTKGKQVEKMQVGKAMVMVEKKMKGEMVYWTKYTWDKEAPSAMVLANYPSGLSILEEDLTTMLIKNAVHQMDEFGSVVICNLFTKPVRRNCANERTLGDAYDLDSMTELMIQTKEAEKVIIAVGSLATRFQIAADRLSQYGALCSKEGVLDKITELVDGQHKLKHPLALQGESWKLRPWSFDWANNPKSRRKAKD